MAPLLPSDRFLRFARANAEAVCSLVSQPGWSSRLEELIFLVVWGRSLFMRWVICASTTSVMICLAMRVTVPFLWNCKQLLMWPNMSRWSSFSFCKIVDDHNTKDHVIGIRLLWRQQTAALRRPAKKGRPVWNPHPKWNTSTWMLFVVWKRPTKPYGIFRLFVELPNASDRATLFLQRLHRVHKRTEYHQTQSRSLILSSLGLSDFISFRLWRSEPRRTRHPSLCKE